MENEDFEITELFTAKAGKDWKKCFHGTITREKNENGLETLVRGKIHIKNDIHDGYIYAMGKDQWELGEKLDELVLMILDKDLHSDSGKKSVITETIFFHN